MMQLMQQVTDNCYIYTAEMYAWDATYSFPFALLWRQQNDFNLKKKTKPHPHLSDLQS